MEKKNKSYYVYIVIILIASIPLINNSLIKVGEVHDIYFHLMRIEGLAEGLLSGQFPVKIQPGWYEGYGYGCSVFYGDIFLYIPALLRMLGISIQGAYKIYVLLCNIVTALIAGYSFGKMFESKRIGLAGSFLYTLSVYRLTNVYVRAAVGEYTAMIFFPLIAYAIFLLLKEKRELRKGWILLSLGMTGIIQCHIISAEIVTVMLGLLCVVCIKRVWNKQVITALMKAVFLTTALNIGFIVPFLDYMLNGKFNVNAINGGWRVEQNIQKSGIPFTQLGRVFYDPKTTEIGVGLALILAVLAFAVFVLINYKRKQSKKTVLIAEIAFLFSILSLWMATSHFPWEAIRRSNVLFRYMVVNIQFPWRLCTIATLSLVLLWCAMGKALPGGQKKRYGRAVSLIVVFLTLVSAGYLMGTIVTTGDYYQVMSVNDMDTRVKSGEEYLPIYTLSGELKNDKIVTDENSKAWNLQRKGIRLEFECQNTSEEMAQIKAPLIYYKGYQATAIDTEQNVLYKLDVFMGENNVVTLQLPPGFQGKVTIDFVEPVYWRIAEAVSLLTVLFLIGFCFYRKKCSHKVTEFENDTAVHR